jgi:molybdopterin-containing oxidoreductase family iron-sulfur binding subunit
MKLMGGAVALAGASALPGCRRPDHKILPYTTSTPEDIVPGKALYFATAMPLPGGGAEGLIVETFEGRPIKVEGNPLHPLNRGKSSAWAQASVLDLYDPDRLKEPMFVRAGVPVAATWDDFAAWSAKHFPSHDADQGAGLAFVVDRQTSPTLQAMASKVAARWPKSSWVWYSPLENVNQDAGLLAAMGSPTVATLSLDTAQVIVSLDRDFLHHEAGSLRHARGFAHGRRPVSVPDTMNRLYMIESSHSITGAMADHRWRAAPSTVTAYAVAIARGVLDALQAPASLPVAAALKTAQIAATDEKAVQAIVKDLVTGKDKSVLLAGASQPAFVHALCAAVNQALGSAGTIVTYAPAPEALAQPGMAAMGKLAARLAAGEIKTLVTLNANPCFDAPGEFSFADAMKKAAVSISLSVDLNETVSHASTWRLNGAHFLESWGDVASDDGTLSVIQPMIAPLYDGKSAIEVLAMILGTPRDKAVGYDLVRQVWNTGPDPEKTWRRTLHDGLKMGSAPKASAGDVKFAKVAEAAASALAAMPKGEKGALEAVFVVSHMADGRYANNPWLNELPDCLSTMVWDNAALLSPATAKRLGLLQTDATDQYPMARMADLRVGGRTVKAAVWAVPGVPDDVVVLPLGWGRATVGVVGKGTGFNFSAVRSLAGAWSAPGATIAPSEDGDRWYPISCTQHYGSMEGRAIAREADMQAWNDAANHEKPKDPRDAYGRKHPLAFAERLDGSELTHMPAVIPVYKNPYDDKENGRNPARGGRPTTGKAVFEIRPQWGMSIDLSTCMGCNVCMIACQAENNIPAVGKIEVQKGRVMHWIRIDRYFKGDNDSDPSGTIFQPVCCVHCEAAPCEVVCPVNATVHGPEGHNYMVYNRCIGTRYCANNCPYKVRRFNFFDYGVTKFNGRYFGRETIDAIIPGEARDGHDVNPNLIPPRVREKLDAISKLRNNPNVTIRSRGVMEKCSLCIQRTNEAKIELKLKGLRPDTDGLPDGFVQTACQQACPTNAIVFGDILDDKSDNTVEPGSPYSGGQSTRKGSLVRALREHERTYALLGYLGTKPRVTHMMRVNNPNPALREPNVHPFGKHGGGHDGDHGGDPAKKGAHATLFVDPIRAGRERGYLGSLSVLT